jgi:hypothetical protein
MLEAEVITSGIEEHHGGHTGRSFEPVIRYRYEHYGIGYEGKRFMFSGHLMTNSRSDAEQFIAPFQPGARITIRVCPTNSRVSTIEPGADRRVWLPMVIGSLLTGMGIAGLMGKLK